jgi:DNA processing protein
MEDLAPWMALIRASGIGPVQQLKLLNLFENPEQIVSATEGQLKSLGLKSETIHSIKYPDDRLIAADVSWVNSPGHFFITWNDLNYPPRLREIHDPPVALFVTGDPDILHLPQVGIVGSRNPTASGRQIAGQFAARLIRSGLVITSGLAFGIDYCAHQGTLDAGGFTIAVLGCGPDRIYPSHHRGIAKKICKQGALVSEFPPATPPLAGHFPRRNRIISGLSLGILVVEADKRSGSLITARYAMEQGREVFAIPGSIYNPLARGCHHLIKQGAKLVESIEDILDELHLNFLSVHAAAIDNINPEDPGTEINLKYKQLLDNMSFDPVSIDSLIEVTGLTSETVSSMLLILEIQGVVSSSGGLYTKIS